MRELHGGLRSRNVDFTGEHHWVPPGGTGTHTPIHQPRSFKQDLEKDGWDLVIIVCLFFFNGVGESMLVYA